MKCANTSNHFTFSSLWELSQGLLWMPETTGVVKLCVTSATRLWLRWVLTDNRQARRQLEAQTKGGGLVFQAEQEPIPLLQTVIRNK